MKASDASRAAILVSALRSNDDLVEKCSHADAAGWMCVTAIGPPFGKNAFGAPDYRAQVVLDAHTATLIAMAADQIIREQLKIIGVEL